jgi:hypothetical protein
MDADTPERDAQGLRRDMFLAGCCVGVSLAGLWCLGAWLVLLWACVSAAVWVAWRGLPWEI